MIQIHKIVSSSLGPFILTLLPSRSAIFPYLAN